ncbi:MAG: hypothetical protein JNL12_13440 [Planctomycetes bacterium]|nr:hypothetical protein [Planctomycetota bacterium]
MPFDPERLAPAIAAGPPARLVVLFGSAAKGPMHAGSDVDIGWIPVDPNLSLGHELAFQAVLTGAAGLEVDLVRLDQASTICRYEVARDGIKLAGDRGEFVRFRADSIGDYPASTSLGSGPNCRRGSTRWRTSPRRSASGWGRASPPSHALLLLVHRQTMQVGDSFASTKLLSAVLALTAASTLTAQVPAYHATVGVGCYDYYSSSLVQEFTGSPAAKAALDGNSLTFVPYAGRYHAVWNAWFPGPVGYVAPTSAATTLSFADDDDGEVTITTSTATPIPGGTTTTWTVSVNGILTAGATANNLGDNSPTLVEVGAATGLAFYTWRDWNVGEAGSGPIQTEKVGNVLYVTWNGVEAASAGVNPGTWQFQVNLLSGNVTIVWDSFEPSASGAPVIVGATLAGASVTPPSTDLTLTATSPFEMGGDIAPMTLSVVGRPVNNGTPPVYTIGNIPEYFPGAGFSVLAAVFGFTAIPGGVNLGAPPYNIGAWGCFAYTPPDVIVIIGLVPFGPSSFPIPWSIPAPPGLLWMQAVSVFVPGSLPNGQNIGGYVVSNALEIYISNT